MKTKLLTLFQEIGNIMYVGGILSHIIISIVLENSGTSGIYHMSLYKEISAYILILPGLALKVITDFIIYKNFEIVPNWFKLKSLFILFLTINAFVFLVPMMPELTQLSKQSLEAGTLSQEFITLAAKEKIVGISNAIPLLLEIILGSSKPKIFGK